MTLDLLEAAGAVVLALGAGVAAVLALLGLALALFGRRP